MTTLKKNTMTLKELPEVGLLRLPAVLEFVPVSETTWKRGVHNGTYPQPVKLSKNCSAWRAQDIRKLLTEGCPQQI